MKNRLVLGSMIALGCITSQIHADPLNKEELCDLKNELNYKISLYEDSLHNVSTLQDREELLSWMIGYVIMVDLVKAENVDKVLSAFYMAFLMPRGSARAREVLEPNLSIGAIDPQRLCNMFSPSGRMRRILDKVEMNITQASLGESEKTVFNERLSPYIPTMGYLAQIYLAITQYDCIVPEFAPDGVQGIVAYPIKVRTDDREAFFKQWYKNIREKFVETDDTRITLELILGFTEAGLPPKIYIECVRKAVQKANLQDGILSRTLQMLDKIDSSLCQQLQDAFSQAIAAGGQ